MLFFISALPYRSTVDILFTVSVSFNKLFDHITVLMIKSNSLHSRALFEHDYISFSPGHPFPLTHYQIARPKWHCKTCEWKRYKTRETRPNVDAHNLWCHNSFSSPTEFISRHTYILGLFSTWIRSIQLLPEIPLKNFFLYRSGTTLSILF